jgi:hypothetical protein
MGFAYLRYEFTDAVIPGQPVQKDLACRDRILGREPLLGRHTQAVEQDFDGPFWLRYGCLAPSTSS